MILRGYHLLRTVPAGCVAFIMFYSRIENDFVFFPDRELGLQPSDLAVPKLLAHGTAY